MKRNPKEVRKGLLVWKSYGRHLTEAQVAEQIRVFGDEGLEFVCGRNSNTTLMFCTNNGFDYPPKRLEALKCYWRRSPYTFVQLRVEGMRILPEVAEEGLVSQRSYKSKLERLAESLRKEAQ